MIDFQDIRTLSEQTALDRARTARKALGSRLVILGHHYQADAIVEISDITGDSLELSRRAGGLESEFIVFCGVHFMAESADMLTSAHQKVILPDLAAGCSMADMATHEELEAALDYLEQDLGLSILPITYVNSSAAVKAVVGRHGGAVCTSTNAPKVVTWALAQPGKTVLFAPDQHLGRNTSFRLGIPLEAMPVWDPKVHDGGAGDDAYRNGKVILWKGHCSVHTRMTKSDVDHWRASDPDRKVLVHPECVFDVVQSADLAGSTSFILDTLEKAPAGSKWAVGTEVNLVGRLSKLHPDKDVVPLSRIQCLCSTMFRIDPWHLCWVLENLVEGTVVNRITVDTDTRRWAGQALERMLALS
ncbi:MAG TPA: quinolinate synthase NadA [Fibrobacteria bacterium]|nr:quinolinate synthase NadA [Fibrobacteria bacterium]